MLEKYDKGGKVKLYHFSSKLTQDKVTLDPQIAVKNSNSYTRRDYAAFSVPRIWFYLNLDQKEWRVDGTLYESFVDTSELYDLTVDPMGLLVDFDSYDELYERVVKNGYAGFAYTVGATDMVVIFYPVVANKKKDT